MLNKAAAVGLICALCGLARAEMVDNPMYQAWAKAEPGTQITLMISPDPNNQNAPQESGTMRLVTVTPEAVTVELGSTNQGEHKQTLTMAAKVESGEEALFIVPPEQRGQFALRNPGKSAEKMTVAGKVTETTCYTANIDITPGGANGPAMTMVLKAWIAPSMPGGLVKLEMGMDAGNGRPPESRTISTVSWIGPDGKSLVEGAAPVVAAASRPAATQGAGKAATMQATTKP